MVHDPLAALEYETMVFGRHLSVLPRRPRRRGGVLDHSAYVLLAILSARGSVTIRQLSDITGLEASTLNRQTAALLRDGYAERISDPLGGAAKKFRLTTSGERILAEERGASQQALDSLTANWTEEDRARLAELLGRLNEAIEYRTGRHWPRPSSTNEHHSGGAHRNDGI